MQISVMRLYRTSLGNPSPGGERLVVFVAECELCGFSAVSIHENDAARAVELHECSADTDGKGDDKAPSAA